MCDYSLEMYRSRPATKGEEYVTSRFPSGSIGFIAAGEPHTAICMACDTRLVLSNLSIEMRQRLNSGDPEARVTFIRIDSSAYRDGVRFADGTEMSLQQLGPGVTASVVKDLVEPVAAATPAVAAKRVVVLEPAE